MVSIVGFGIHAAAFLFLQAASGLAVSWLPTDNQLVYKLVPGQIKRIELNTTHIVETPVFITVSPCNKDITWTVYKGTSNCGDDKLILLYEYNSEETKTFSALVSKRERYLLQLSSNTGGAAAVSVRGEAAQHVRLRLRARSKRKLAANWDPRAPKTRNTWTHLHVPWPTGTRGVRVTRNIRYPWCEELRTRSDEITPIDPQATIYCLVASQTKKYTSLCAAQNDAMENKIYNKGNEDSDVLDFNMQIDENRNNINTITKEGIFDVYEGNFKSYNRRKKFSRSTKVTNEDPVIACVGGRGHHLIENLDLTKNYFVSLFGVGDDRRAGTLLARATLRPRTSTARRLKQDQPYRIDLKGRAVFYYKTAVNVGGIWLAVSTCVEALDLEVLVKGKRLSVQKNIGPYSKIFIPAATTSTSIQETSDEDSVQSDSSSEEFRVRYVIKVSPSWRDENDNAIRLELLASPNRWGGNAPELAPEDGATVREIRPHRSCKSLQIAFLPATHQTADNIRYCVTAREGAPDEHSALCSSNRIFGKTNCITQTLPSKSRVIIQKITGLRAGRKYAIQVTASTKNFAVPYNILYANTNTSCKND